MIIFFSYKLCLAVSTTVQIKESTMIIATGKIEPDLYKSPRKNILILLCICSVCPQVYNFKVNKRMQLYIHVFIKHTIKIVCNSKAIKEI